jgi:hypothetical protein
LSELHVGFTGTRRGMTPLQEAALRALLRDLQERTPGDATYVLHHGLCRGGDEQAHVIAGEEGWYVEVHPGVDARGDSPQRAVGLEYDDHVREVHDERPYPERNLDIVDSCVLLIVGPSGPARRRSGTWSTTRAALRLGRSVFVLPPVDGWETPWGGPEEP